MALALAGGIPTHYEVVGTGPPLLLLSPGGFNATMANWELLGKYCELQLVRHLSARYSCIVFDRREAGESGGAVERLTWCRYAHQALGLLDHLRIEQADLLGGCTGCSVALATAIASPTRVGRMVLYWPAGGAKYRMSQQQRFSRHLAFVEEEGLQGVVTLSQTSAQTFSEDPRVGPWAALLRNDPEFAAHYITMDHDRYRTIVIASARTLFDRDTVSGAEAEDLLALDAPALIVPGRDNSHATSAARYLEECLPNSEYWNAGVDEQTEDRVAALVLDFLSREAG